MGIEFELKYRSDPTQQAAIRAAVAGQEQAIHMHTTYYDTPDGDLSARHYTLRQRMENQCSVCALKYPAGEAGRGEIELAYDKIDAALPELCKQSKLADLPALLEKGVVPVCGAKFDRIAIPVTLADCTLELALDSGILYGGGKELPLCEVEVELKSGNRETARAYGTILAARYGLVPETASKFRRALALTRGI